ncbi:hypothetical protein ACFL08_03415 [Patescibacteria group bacterium]
MILTLVVVFVVCSLVAAGLLNHQTTGNVFKCDPKIIHFLWLLSGCIGVYAAFVVWIVSYMPK